MTTKTITRTASTIQEAKPSRRYDIDWLRVLAVLLLLPFHTARIFDTFGPFYVKNNELSKGLTYFIMYTFPWHMPLLFLLAGASTYFALKFRSGGQYAKERFKRLLLPLIFGLLIIVPLQSFYGLLFHSNASPTYLEFLTNFFQLHGADPDGYRLGGFTLGHLWFILFLFVFSLVALPIILLLKRKGGEKLIGWLATFFSWPGTILLLAVPLWLTGQLMGYPNPIYFFTLFIFGYILFADERFDKAINKHKVVALILGPIPFLIAAYYQTVGWPSGIPAGFVPILKAYVDGFAAWFFLIAILGYGRLLLSFSNRFLQYMGEASYPYYILHQTIIVIIGYYVVQWQLGFATKYLIILAAATAVTALLYEVLVKRFNLFRILFGLKPLKKEKPPMPAPKPG
jgi:peptidoglycan/LPS O-acetylase OafA/YrhL